MGLKWSFQNAETFPNTEYSGKLHMNIETSGSCSPQQGKLYKIWYNKLHQRVGEGFSTLEHISGFTATPYSFPATVQNATMNTQPNKAEPHCYR